MHESLGYKLFCVVVILVFIVYILGIYCQCISCDLVFICCFVYVLFNDVQILVQVNNVSVLFCCCGAWDFDLHVKQAVFVIVPRSLSFNKSHK